MAYLDSRPRPSTGSIVAVLAVHGALAAALIYGLSASGDLVEREIFAGFQLDPPKPPPPPEPPKPQPRNAQIPDRPIVAPLPPIPIPRSRPDIVTTPDILPPLPPLPPGNEEGLAKAVPTPAPSFPAIAAKPRNDPNRWVTTEDYRGNWIRQEMTGRARFRLEIAADGRVAGCTITGSSGHPELDAATCALVARRARFQPARGGEGEPVPGSYGNAIDWQLPD